MIRAGFMQVIHGLIDNLNFRFHVFRSDDLPYLFTDLVVGEQVIQLFQIIRRILFIDRSLGIFVYFIQLIFKIPKLIEYISNLMTLEPGDIISTGTPEGIAPIQPGDVLEATVEKIGTLVNYVRSL